MPQLDIDLLEDFLFFAFAAFILGFGDDENEENVIDLSSEAYLATYCSTISNQLFTEVCLVSASSSKLINTNL